MICMKHLTSLQQHAGLALNIVFFRGLSEMSHYFTCFADDIQESGLGNLPQIQVLRGELS